MVVAHTGAHRVLYPGYDQIYHDAGVILVL